MPFLISQSKNLKVKPANEANTLRESTTMHAHIMIVEDSCSESMTVNSGDNADGTLIGKGVAIH